MPDARLRWPFAAFCAGPRNAQSHATNAASCECLHYTNEPAFKLPQGQWKARGGKGAYKVLITVPKESATQEFFYFRHIHHGMSGKVLVSGAPTPSSTKLNTLQFNAMLGEAY